MRFSVMADTARRALEFAKDYRRYNANNQLDTLLNQLNSLRNFLETPAMEIEKRHQIVLSKRLETLEDKVELAKETGLQFDR